MADLFKFLKEHNVELVPFCETCRNKGYIKMPDYEENGATEPCPECFKEEQKRIKRMRYCVVEHLSGDAENESGLPVVSIHPARKVSEYEPDKCYVILGTNLTAAAAKKIGIKRLKSVQREIQQNIDSLKINF